MVRTLGVVVATLAAAATLPSALSAAVQKAGLTVPASYQGNAESVKAIFKTSYDAYKQFAFGHDDLHPTSKSFGDSRNGWGATIVDAMSTAHIMGFDDIFNEAVNFSSNIDFSKSKTSGTVSVFETTIRYLGGLLSAYEISNQPALLAKAKQVADKLAFAWVGNNDIPFGNLNFSSNTPTTGTNSAAGSGTLILEWETLSKLSGNATYGQLAEKALRRIASNNSPLPGLPAQGINPSGGTPVGGYVTWGAGTDSYFEYLIKHARLSNTPDNFYANTWLTAVDSSIATLLRTTTVGNLTFLADFDDNRRIRHVGSHLACFYGANWLFGAQLTNNATIRDIALRLVDGCWETYAGTTTGIGPETFAYISSDGNFTGSGISSSQLSFYNQHGYYIQDGRYILRPEVLESIFYAWRITGDTKYLDRAVSVVGSFQKFLGTTVGYDGINDVNSATPGKLDDEESFFFAETLKYLFLIFDDPSKWSLDDYVFNTEAHPFKAPAAKDSYGTGRLTAKQAPFIPTPGTLPIPSGRPWLKH